MSQIASASIGAAGRTDSLSTVSASLMRGSLGFSVVARREKSK